MGRIVGSVIVGYIVMFAVVFLALTLAWLVLGADRAFEPGTYGISVLWAITAVLVGVIAAVAGGYVCATIAKSPTGPKALAVVVVLLGLVSAAPLIMGSGEDGLSVREAAVGLFEAMGNARQPLWMALLNPLIGALGVILGARLKTRSSQPASPVS